MEQSKESIKIKSRSEACPHCGQHHDFNEVDHEDAANDFTDTFFDKVWKNNKQELKEMSKKEIAEQMYFLGVFHFMKSMNEMMNHITEELDNEDNRKS